MKTGTNGSVKRSRGVDPALSGETELREIKLTDPNLVAFGEMDVRIEGLSPFLMSDPDIKMLRMLQQQCGELEPAAQKSARDLDEEFLESLSVIGNRPKTVAEAQAPGRPYGCPAASIRRVMEAVARASGKFKKDITQSVFVLATDGRFVRLIDNTPPVQHTSRVRNSDRARTAAVRMRALFEKWAIEFKVRFNSRAITPEMIVSLLTHGGEVNGLGEWRVERGGEFGRFKVVSAKAKLPKLGGNG